MILSLYSEGVYPEFWWAVGANARGIGADLNRSLDLQIPETEYYYIDLFQSIEELKQATEQAVSEDYAEKYLTIFYKGIMPSEKVLDLPVDCNTLAGSVNL